MSDTFELLLKRITSLRREHAGADGREVCWILDRRLGVALDPHGGFELFLAGAIIHARTALVAACLKTGEWRTASGVEFTASRIVLPPGAHFATIAAVVVFELLQGGIGDRRSEEAFTKVEPILELCLRNASLSENSVLGLMGELLLLQELLFATGSAPQEANDVLDCWTGFRSDARDFRLGWVSIEVKTTRSTQSTHPVHGFGQTELAQNEAEGRLYLLSVGMEESHGGTTLPQRVDDVLAALSPTAVPGERSALQKRFLQRLREYGAVGAGYDHDEAVRTVEYATSYRPTFQPRLYDINDPEIYILRRADLQSRFAHVAEQGLQQTVQLPAVVSATNPAGEWRRALRELLAEHLAGQRA